MQAEYMLLLADRMTCNKEKNINKNQKLTFGQKDLITGQSDNLVTFVS